MLLVLTLWLSDLTSPNSILRDCTRDCFRCKDIISTSNSGKKASDKKWSPQRYKRCEKLWAAEQAILLWAFEGQSIWARYYKTCTARVDLFKLVLKTPYGKKQIIYFNISLVMVFTDALLVMCKTSIIRVDTWECVVLQIQLGTIVKNT